MRNHLMLKSIQAKRSPRANREDLCSINWKKTARSQSNLLFRINSAVEAQTAELMARSVLKAKWIMLRKVVLKILRKGIERRTGAEEESEK